MKRNRNSENSSIGRNVVIMVESIMNRSYIIGIGVVNESFA